MVCLSRSRKRRFTKLSFQKLKKENLCTDIDGISVEYRKVIFQLAKIVKTNPIEVTTKQLMIMAKTKDPKNLSRFMQELNTLVDVID